MLLEIKLSKVHKHFKYNCCDYSVAYILVRSDTTLIGRNNVTQVAFKNCATFTKCITTFEEMES